MAQNILCAMNEIEILLDDYIRERKTRIDVFLHNHLDKNECLKIQKASFLKDIVKNPVNVLWAIPYFSIKKFLEIGDKLGVQTAGKLLHSIPKSLKTDYQKEIERIVLNELFEVRKLENTLRPVCSPELHELLIRDLRSEISQYCNRQNEVTDLMASGFIVMVSHYSFGDKTLDLFGLGSKFAQKWTQKKAAKEFFLGENIGQTFYKYVPVSASEKHVFWFTAAVILLFAVVTTTIGILSFPTQKRFGITRNQLNLLTNQIHDRLLLSIAKSRRNLRKAA